MKCRLATRTTNDSAISVVTHAFRGGAKSLFRGYIPTMMMRGKVDDVTHSAEIYCILNLNANINIIFNHYIESNIIFNYFPSAVVGLPAYFCCYEITKDLFWKKKEAPPFFVILISGGMGGICGC